ncbi:hypothetical protein A9J41_02705 [Laribacter hongkongensis]|uniref:phage tail assembly protein n=1 Tax=Laribacter hongkongensis TaxID=168471 RepID=UPI00187897B3|nr:phage tail assembly protein [Laribacter hongkongensis]MBE5528665.1 hypothetical protein [Laribacter hongkongensis]
MNEIVITLKKPVQLNGITVNQLAKSNEEREIMMLSRLCDCAHTDLRALTLRDYAALQDAFFRLAADEPAGKNLVDSGAAAGG